MCAQLKRFSLDIPNNFMKVGKRDSEVKPYFHSCYLRPTKWYARRPRTPSPGLTPLKKSNLPSRHKPIQQPPTRQCLRYRHQPRTKVIPPRASTTIPSRASPPPPPRNPKGHRRIPQGGYPLERRKTNQGGRQPFRARRLTSRDTATHTCQKNNHYRSQKPPRVPSTT